MNQMNLVMITFRFKYFYALLLHPNLQHQGCCLVELTLNKLLLSQNLKNPNQIPTI